MSNNNLPFKNSIINESSFFCFCGHQIKISPEEDLNKHIKNCKNYMNDSPVAKIFLNINLGKFNLPQLLALKCEYNYFIEVLNSEIEKRGVQGKSQIYSHPHQQQLSSTISPAKKIQPADPVLDLESSTKSTIFKNKLGESRLDLKFLAAKKVPCMNCKKELMDFDVELFWYVEPCFHLFCRACLIKYIKQEFIKNEGQLHCLLPKCKSLLTERDFKNLLKPEKYDKLNEELFEKQFNIIKCVKCSERFEFMKGKPEAHQKDSSGRVLSKKLAVHYAENRCLCLKCKTEQCIGCKTIPYHEGFVCDEFAKQKQFKKCRYCELAIQNVDLSRPPAIREICDENECKAKRENACHRILKCNHPCSGFLNEAECLPCLNDECAEKMQEALFNQKGSDYCNICFIEGLMNAPCVMIKCGHIFHLHCISKRLEIRWHRPRITFNFCLCPLCKVWMEFPADSPLQVKMQENSLMFEDIKKKSLERLKHEGNDKDDKLKNPADPYFNKPMEYAIAIYSYYQCFKCKKPYFGGRKNCEMMLQEDAGAKQDFDPKELVCANCCDVLPLENCSKHGKEYIEFKCKFCCNVAQWFCWGNTHFCEPCHKRQCNGDYVSKYTKDKLPKCIGKEKCPLRIDHKPNGEEFALGCSLCRNFKENEKGF